MTKSKLEQGYEREVERSNLGYAVRNQNLNPFPDTRYDALLKKVMSEFSLMKDKLAYMEKQCDEFRMYIEELEDELIRFQDPDATAEDYQVPTLYGQPGAGKTYAVEEE
jgi:flagellar biosynthesis GTPase FlhF